MLFPRRTVVFAFSNKDGESSRRIEHNGIEFLQDGSGYWHFQIQEQDFATRYNPREVEDFPVQTFLNLNSYSEKPLYFIGGMQDPSYEIIRNLGNFILRVNEACLPGNESECIGDFPIKDCSVDNVIIFREIDVGNESVQESERFYQEDNCVFIVGSFENQTRIADAFVFIVA